MSTVVHVAIYKKVDDRDAAHWALWLEGPNSADRILQTGDDQDGIGYFVERPQAMRPDSSATLHDTVQCGTIPAEHSLDSLVELVQTRPVNNNSTTWNCQNWVMDALDALAEKKGLEIPRDVKNKLESRRENPQYPNPRAGEAAKPGKPQ